MNPDAGDVTAAQRQAGAAASCSRARRRARCAAAGTAAVHGLRVGLKLVRFQFLHLKHARTMPESEPWRARTAAAPAWPGPCTAWAAWRLWNPCLCQCHLLAVTVMLSRSRPAGSAAAYGERPE